MHFAYFFCFLKDDEEFASVETVESIKNLFEFNELLQHKALDLD